MAAAFAIVPGRGAATARCGGRRPPRVAVVPVLLAPWWLPALVHGAGEALLLDGGPAAGAARRRPRPAHRPGRRPRRPVVARRRAGRAGRARAACRASPGSRCWSAGSSRWSRPWRPPGSGAVRSRLPPPATPAGLGFLVVVLQGAFVVAAFIGAPGLAARGAGGAWPPAPGRSRWLAVRRRRGAARRARRGSWPAAGDHLREAADDRHPGVHGAELDARRRPRDPRGPRRRRARADLHACGAATASRSARTRSSTSPPRTPPSRATSARWSRGPPRRPSTSWPAQGIEYVVLPAPADGDVASALDATGGLVQASAEDRSTRAWQVDRTARPATPSTAPAPGCGSLLLVAAGHRDRGGRGALRAHHAEEARA